MPSTIPYWNQHKALAQIRVKWYYRFIYIGWPHLYVDCIVSKNSWKFVATYIFYRLRISWPYFTQGCLPKWMSCFFVKVNFYSKITSEMLKKLGHSSFHDNVIVKTEKNSLSTTFSMHHSQLFISFWKYICYLILGRCQERNCNKTCNLVKRCQTGI